ncbi:hypothetical protein EYR41_005039 [Orbilia oligospora]|uniref:Uncharacterized protein n=1 Tax=Orbilia oligospora TaxID=2813651 RepID=A0A8H2E1Y5_ORBOL|nr:hypothetical protein EYR41_005039 [Orbilia oligospora]
MAPPHIGVSITEPHKSAMMVVWGLEDGPSTWPHPQPPANFEAPANFDRWIPFVPSIVKLQRNPPPRSWSFTLISQGIAYFHIRFKMRVLDGVATYA